MTAPTGPEQQHSADYVALAQATAEAMGKDFLIGVRPNGRGWYANCGGVEYDGGSPEVAVRQVVEQIQAKVRDEVRRARMLHEELVARYAELMDLDTSDPLLIDGSQYGD